MEDYKSDDRYDIVAFRYDEPASNFPELRRRFLEFSAPWEVDAQSIVFCFAVGCAFCDQIVNLYDVRHLHLARRNHECRYLESSSLAGIERAKDVTGDSFDPNGMSGGAIIYVRESAVGPVVEFGGMIQRAGNSFYHYINATQIALFLDAEIKASV
jgi:hypothetical protein